MEPSSDRTVASRRALRATGFVLVSVIGLVWLSRGPVEESAIASPRAPVRSDPPAPEGARFDTICSSFSGSCRVALPPCPVAGEEWILEGAVLASNESETLLLVFPRVVRVLGNHLAGARVGDRIKLRTVVLGSDGELVETEAIP